MYAAEWMMFKAVDAAAVAAPGGDDDAHVRVNRVVNRGRRKSSWHILVMSTCLLVLLCAVCCLNGEIKIYLGYVFMYVCLLSRPVLWN